MSLSPTSQPSMIASSFSSSGDVIGGGDSTAASVGALSLAHVSVGLSSSALRMKSHLSPYSFGGYGFFTSASLYCTQKKALMGCERTQHAHIKC